MEKKWDRVRIVCSQPFRKNMQFGLTFFKLHSQDVFSESNPLNSPNAKINTEIKDEMMSILSSDKLPLMIPERLD